MLMKQLTGGTVGGGINGFEVLAYSTGGSNSQTWQAESGKKYLILLFATSSGSLSPTTFEGATCSGGTITKLQNLTTATASACGTFYEVDATSASVTVSHTNNFGRVLFGTT